MTSSTMTVHLGGAMNPQSEFGVRTGATGHGEGGEAAETRASGHAKGASGADVVDAMDNIRRMTLREANRIHCRATRERTREKERLLRQEVEVLMLYKAIVDNGPDLFSMHGVDIEARFSFISATFYERMGLVPKDVLGQPLASIVDPRDAFSLKTAVTKVLNPRGAGREGEDDNGPNGTLVNLRMACGGLSHEASMTITIGSEGLVVVTRLY